MSNLRMTFRAPAPVAIEVNETRIAFLNTTPRLALQLPGVQGPPGSSSGVTDGDKGDIVVSSSGAVWLIQDGAVTEAKLSPGAIALFATAAQGGLADTALQPGALIPWTTVTGKPATFPPAAHTHPIAEVTGLAAGLLAKQDALGFTPQDASAKGQPGGYAALDGGGKVPAAQLPSFVDDVIEVADVASLPVTGETGKLYITIDQLRQWRWSGSAYAEISPSPGSTDSVPEGSVNLYHTPARVRGVDLTGYSIAGSRLALAAGDTILGAFNKLGRWVADLANVAFTGSASDLTSGTLPAARFNDTAHGNRGGGALHADVVAGGASGFMSGADKTKLNGIAIAATANATDAALRDRATHTGTQTAATISDLAEAVQDLVAAMAVAGSGVTIVYDDVLGTLTFSATGGGGGANLSWDASTRTLASDTGTDAVLTLVDNTNPGLALAPEVGPDRFFAFTDLVNTTTSELFAVSTAGTSASVTIVAPQDGGHGWAQLNLGTTTTGRAGIGTVTFNLRFGLGAAGFKARYRATNLSDATNTYTKRVGFVDSLAAESTDGAFFRYTHSVNGGRWQAVTRSNNVETAVDTGVTVAANTTYKFEVDVNAAGNEAVFKIDGTTVATITTNIPTGSGRETGYGSFALRSAGTSAFSPGALDYLWVEQRFTGR